MRDPSQIIRVSQHDCWRGACVCGWGSRGKQTKICPSPSAPAYTRHVIIRGAAVDPHWIEVIWGCSCWVVGAVLLCRVGDAAYLMWHCARAQGGWGA